MRFESNTYTPENHEIIYPLDEDGNKVTFKVKGFEYGIGRFEMTIAKTWKFIPYFRLRQKSLLKITTSKFETSNVNQFTSLKLKNYILKS